MSRLRMADHGGPALEPWLPGAPDDTFRKWRWPTIVPCQRGRWRAAGRRQREERARARAEASEPFMAEEPSRRQRSSGEPEPLLIWDSGWERKAGGEGGGGGVGVGDPQHNSSLTLMIRLRVRDMTTTTSAAV